MIKKTNLDKIKYYYLSIALFLFLLLVYLSIPSINKLKRDKLIKKIKKDFFDVRFLPEKKFLFSDQISINDLNIDEINNI